MTALAKKDLLYTIFEQHLFNFQDPNSDRQTFILTIVKDYLTQLRKLGLSVPKELEEMIFEELFFQVNTMLVKKIYGCLTINEFTEKTKKKTKEAKILAGQKNRARKAYAELNQTASEAEANSAPLKKTG